MNAPGSNSNRHDNDAGFDDVILSVEGVTKVYPGTIALKEVNFAVRRGAVNVLVGENGAGKSTMMKIIAGAEQPSMGRLLLDGMPVELASSAEVGSSRIRMRAS